MSLRSTWKIKLFGMVIAEGHTFDSPPLYQCPCTPETIADHLNDYLSRGGRLNIQQERPSRPESIRSEGHQESDRQIHQ